MKTTPYFILALTLLCVPVFGQSAAEIRKQSQDVVDVGNLEMAFTIHIRDSKGNDRVRKLSMASKKFGETSKTLIRFTAPADVKGTALLIYDNDKQADDIWIYMPALKKVRRIVSAEKGKSFMGSEFTNADMSKPNPSDFTYTTVGTVTLNGLACWKIESAGNSKEIQTANGCSKQVSYIDKSSYLCYKVEFYDLSGKLQRVQTINNYKKLTGGNYMAYQMIMENVVTKRVSEMIVDKASPSTQLSESSFSPTALDK